MPDFLNAEMLFLLTLGDLKTRKESNTFAKPLVLRLCIIRTLLERKYLLDSRDTT